MVDNDSQQEPLRLGFIGGGLNSAVGTAHAIACRMDNCWTLEAGSFSRDAKQNRDTARQYGVRIERAIPDWRQLLREEKGKLDALVVLTPSPVHAEIVSECLRAGFPVICEKALTSKSGDAGTIQNLVKELGAFLVVTYNYSGYPMIRELRYLIQQGMLGRILHFQVEMPQDGYIRLDALGHRPQPQQWRIKDGLVPVIHLDLAVHLHQLLHYLIGEKPVQVIANQGCFGQVSGVVDNVSVMLEYSGDIHGQMWFSKSALGYRNGLKLRLFGSEAAAEWNQSNPEELVLYRKDGRRIILDRAAKTAIAGCVRYNRFKPGHPDGFLEAFANLYVDIAQCLRKYKKTGKWQSGEVFGVELAMEGLLMIEAMAESTRTRTWVKV